jgi:plasmid maintenance system killer protein
MDITFKSKQIQKIFNSDKKLIKAYGKGCANKITQRCDDLKSASTLEAFKNLPGRCHELKGNLKNYFSLDLEHPFRLIFTPSNNGVLLKPDGGLDRRSVTAIEIIDVEDTHD